MALDLQSDVDNPEGIITGMDNDGRKARRHIAEIFSPPRAVPVCKGKALKRTMRIDLETGYNLLLPETQRQVLQHIDTFKPLDLITSAPCVWYFAPNRLVHIHKMSNERKAREGCGHPLPVCAGLLLKSKWPHTSTTPTSTRPRLRHGATQSLWTYRRRLERWSNTLISANSASSPKSCQHRCRR